VALALVKASEVPSSTVRFHGLGRDAVGDDHQGAGAELKIAGHVEIGGDDFRVADGLDPILL
jgi:hypothetical protein